jgi:hypothetical protein
MHWLEAHRSCTRVAIGNARYASINDGLAGVADFITDDNAAKYRQLRSAAQQAMRILQRDPAGFIGDQAALLLTARAVSGAVPACRAAAQQLRAIQEGQARAR